MIYTDMTVKAMRLAYHAHRDQVDKGGVPYVFHPYHLAEQMNNEIRVCAALLHDVVEDTDVTLDYLKSEFPPAVTAIVELLTHEEEVDYNEYVAAICTNADAAFVKLADLVHNMREDRLVGQQSNEQIQRRLQKYAEAFRMVVQFLKTQFSRESEDEKLFKNIMKEYHDTSRKLANGM